MHYLPVLALFYGLCGGILQAKPLIQLERVGAKSLGGVTLLTVNLDHAPNWQDIKIQAQESYLEFNLPSTSLSSDLKLIDNIGSPYVLKVVPIKQTADALALRMYVSEQGKLVQRATATEIAGKQIFITIDHRKLEEILTSIKLSKGNETVKHAGFAEMVRHIGIALATAMAMLLFLLIGMRWMVRDKTNQPHPPSCPMKVIWRLKITSKHRLLLVEVYGQVMLLASDAGGITLLSDNPCPISKLDDKDNEYLLNQSNLEAQKSIQKQTNLASATQPHTSPNTGIEDMANIIHRKLSNI